MDILQYTNAIKDSLYLDFSNGNVKLMELGLEPRHNAEEQENVSDISV